MRVKLEIPKGDREVLLFSGDITVAEAIKKNGQELNSTPIEIAGTPLKELRSSLKKRLRRLAESYCQTKAECDEDYIVLSGHQPLFYGPGILAKELLLQRLSSKYCSIDLIVDTDIAKDISVKVPLRRNGHYIQHELVLLKNEKEQVFSELEAPPKSRLERFAEMVLERLKTLESQAPCESAERFLEILVKSRDRFRNFRDWMVFSQREFLNSAVLDLPVSIVCETEEFKSFVFDVLINQKQFGQDYNRALRDYQQKYGSSPAPKLELGELPFWLIDEAGQRRRAFTKEKQGGWIIEGKRIQGKEDLNKLRLAPRALTLTLFHRLFASELFVHGIGGGKYDRATDQIIKEFYQLTPPRYAYISLTLHLPERSRYVTQSEVKKLERTVTEFEHNPVKHLGWLEVTAEQRRELRELAKEKEGLIKKIKTADGPEKAELGERIEEIKGRMSLLLEDPKSRLVDQLEQVRQLLNDRKVIEDREYPFFFFSPNEVLQILEEGLDPYLQILFSSFGLFHSQGKND